MSGYDFNNVLKTPKNLKQMGNPDDIVKIYMEDYVRVYLEQEAGSNYSEESYALLIGEIRQEEIYIRGAVKIPGQENKKFFPISEQIWTELYRTMHQYFQSNEIVGWFAGGLTIQDEMMSCYKQYHQELFNGNTRVFFTYGWIEKEDRFYISEKGNMRRLEGYYVYYDRNDEMQRYMLACSVNKVEKKNEFQDIEEEKPEKSISQQKEVIETIIKKEGRKPKNGQTVFKLGYTACALLIISAFIAGNLMLNQRKRVQDNNEHANIAQSDSVSETENIFLKEDNSISTITITEGAEEKDNNTTDDNATGNTVIEGNATGSETDKEKGNGSDSTKTDTDESKESDGANNTKTNEVKECDGSNNTNTDEVKESDGLNSNNTDELDESSISENTQTDEVKTDDTSESNETGSVKEDSVSESTGSENFLLQYTVVDGDTLAGISRKLYGNMSYIAKICEMNNLKDENKIEIGQVLIVPGR